jgi:hypothetical protein
MSWLFFVPLCPLSYFSIQFSVSGLRLYSTCLTCLYSLVSSLHLGLNSSDRGWDRGHPFFSWFQGLLLCASLEAAVSHCLFILCDSWHAKKFDQSSPVQLVGLASSPLRRALLISSSLVLQTKFLLQSHSVPSFHTTLHFTFQSEFASLGAIRFNVKCHTCVAKTRHTDFHGDCREICTCIHISISIYKSSLNNSLFVSRRTLSTLIYIWLTLQIASAVTFWSG